MAGVEGNRSKEKYQWKGARIKELDRAFYYLDCLMVFIAQSGHKKYRNPKGFLHFIIYFVTSSVSLVFSAICPAQYV